MVSNDFFAGVAEALKQGQTVKLVSDGKEGATTFFTPLVVACL